jgi:hypothetical protein
MYFPIAGDCSKNELIDLQALTDARQGSFWAV